MKKKLATLLLSGTIAISTLSTALASGWIQDQVGWWYQNYDGSYPTNGWHWIDGNNDGSAECYYFNEVGYCLINTTTPDGYTVDTNGAWVVSGAIQTKEVSVIPSALLYSGSTTAPVSDTVVQSVPSGVVPSGVSTTPQAVSNAQTITATESSWPGNKPYVPGMIIDMPSEGDFWTVNIKSGKYHGNPYVNNLYQENTRYYLGSSSVLEDYGYVRCKLKGCY